MTHNNALRLLLLVLCLATILTAVSSCSKHDDLAPQRPATTQDAYFSHVRFFNDGRKPATDTVWTLHLTTQLLIDTYKNQDGYLFNQTSTYAERGVLWSR